MTRGGRKSGGLLGTRRSILTGLGGLALGLAVGGRGSPLGAGESAGEEAKLNFYNWDTFIGETTLADFEAATGIGVTATVYASSEELFSMLYGNDRYDVVVPGNDDLERLVRHDMLAPLDHAKIPNLANIAPDFINPPFDPGCAHGAPYAWDVVGIGYRKSKVDGVPDSWKWLYDSDKYSGRIALSADANITFRTAFKYLGQSAGSNAPALIAEAAALLAKQKPRIMAFHEDTGQDLLAWNAADLVLEYNGDIAQLMEKDDDIGFVVPREGSLRECNVWSIPKGAPHPENAHKFINFMLDPKVGAEIYKTIKYPSPNAAATALMPDSYKNNPAIFPPADALAKCDYATYGGPEVSQLFDEAMSRVRAA